MDYLLQLDPLLLVPFFLVVLLMALPHLSRKMKGRVTYTTTEELHNLKASGKPVVLVDLRPEKEFVRERIEGSVNIRKAELQQRVGENEAEMQNLKRQPVVLVCKSDLDSMDAARFMEKSGFSNVSVLRGGFYRWKRDRRPMIKE